MFVGRRRRDFKVKNYLGIFRTIYMLLPRWESAEIPIIEIMYKLTFFKLILIFKANHFDRLISKLFKKPSKSTNSNISHWAAQVSSIHVKINAELKPHQTQILFFLYSPIFIYSILKTLKNKKD